MKNILLACSFFVLVCCSSNKKILYYQGDTVSGGLNLEFNLQTMKYSYWGMGFQGNSSQDFLENSSILYSIVYFEGSFKISKGLLKTKYLLNAPRRYYYLPFNIKDDPIYIELCNDALSSENRMELKKRGTTYSLNINKNFDKVDCLQKLRVDGLGGIKEVKKLDLGDWKILDTINFKPLHPDFFIR